MSEECPQKFLIEAERTIKRTFSLFEHLIPEEGSNIVRNIGHWCNRRKVFSLLFKQDVCKILCQNNCVKLRNYIITRSK